MLLNTTKQQNKPYITIFDLTLLIKILYLKPVWVFAKKNFSFSKSFYRAANEALQNLWEFVIIALLQIEQSNVFIFQIKPI